MDGYKDTLCELDKLTCRDDWLITLEQWEIFNATCTKLREFHWVVAPFGDPFFQVFGEYVKPQLKKLTFAVNMLWKWDAYFEECELGSGVAFAAHRALDEFSERPGYGIHATDVSSAIKGCPALDDLEIKLYHPVDEDDFGYDAYDNDIDDFPDREMLNIDIFDDRFCETLAAHCPMLTSLSIMEVAEGQNSNLTPIKAFTDRGLVALAQLKFLTAMHLRTVSCTGKGVFEFLNRLSDEFTGQRTFQICLETAGQNISFIRRKLVLRLMNSNLDSVDVNWSKSYLRRLEKLVKAVKQKHPSLRLRITTSSRRGKTFRSIIELGLYTAKAEPSRWYGWDDEEKNRDVTFMNRSEGMPFNEGRPWLPVELRHPELLDPDSLPIDYELPADYFDDYGSYGDYEDYGDYGDYDDYHDYGGYDDGDLYDGNADELWE
ncbi:hypothetical protein BBO99_00005488 [Phytophthora kernoviae]|uniref:Uncharacterized protein n=2 Tax=Phytophthora kernoviae TaxID=325452 RepID=A0A3R7KTM2_9STRA|nr:hypothetical protein G195_007472 [Phytophthora kernoviae 00238/432]KAG2520462.1 hypothetical protein JM16_006687 [Phytophthora kernoviae]KAG2521535.1 hypothetical protein JM18_006528 [Phytophthora kernoviae]RLN46033.1 hypothetical protein BBI17_005591 [Phytophthora kernoviae]RLN79129.1 hypothetical protein BBO99_00005488 [Phytophthora kernoviae]